MRSLRRSWLIALVLGCAISAGGRASADPVSDAATTPRAEETPKDRARSFVLDAADAAADGRWGYAEDLVRSAWELEKTFDVAANLGDIELRNGKPRAAAKHLSYSLRALPPTASAADQKRIRARFEEARKLVAAISVRVQPEGASVLVDGEVAGTAPLADDVYVDPGEHTITAQREGYEAATQVVHAGKGDALEVKLELRPKAAPIASQSTMLAPARVSSVAFSPVAFNVVKSAEREGPRMSIIAAGGAIVILGTALGVGLEAGASRSSLVADRKKEELNQRFGATACHDEPFARVDCDELLGTLETLDTLRLASRISFGVAGTALGSSILYMVATRKSPDVGRATKVVPSVTANAGSLVVMGVW